MKKILIILLLFASALHAQTTVTGIGTSTLNFERGGRIASYNAASLAVKYPTPVTDDGLVEIINPYGGTVFYGLLSDVVIAGQTTGANKLAAITSTIATARASLGSAAIVPASGVVIDPTVATGTLAGSAYDRIQIFNDSGSNKTLTLKNSSTGATIGAWVLATGTVYEDIRRIVGGSIVECFTVDYPIGVRITAKAK